MAGMLEKITSFIEKSDYRDFPSSVIEKAKLCLLDTLGALLGGAHTPAGQKALLLSLESEPSPLLFPQEMALMRIYALSTMASSLDIEDGYNLARGHPGSTVIPPSLLLGTRKKIGGRELITAIIIGYEIALRCGEIINREYTKKAHGSGTFGIYGSAAACSHILGLGAKSIRHALGLAEAYAPAAPVMLSIRDGAMVKESIGFGTMGGSLASLLAERGFTAHTPTMGQPFSKEIDLSPFSDLGRDYRIMDVYFKPYPACRWAHPALEALESILEKNPLREEEIKEVQVETFSQALSLDHREAKSQEEIQYSIPLSLSLLILHKRFTPDLFREEIYQREEVEEMAHRILLKEDREYTRRFPKERGARVVVETLDGKVFTQELDNPKGGEERPLSRKERKDKFLEVTGEGITREKKMESIHRIEKIEEMESIRELTSLFQVDSLLY